MNGTVFTKGQLLHQFIGTRAVKPYPIIFPWVFHIGGIGDELIGLGQKNIPRGELKNGVVKRVGAFSAGNIVD